MLKTIEDTSKAKKRSKQPYMIDIKEYKKILGSLTKELSEEEILRLREQQYKEAEIFFYSWLENIKKSNV